MCLCIQPVLWIFLLICSWGSLDIVVCLTVLVGHKAAQTVEGHTFVLQGGVSEACRDLKLAMETCGGTISGDTQSK